MMPATPRRIEITPRDLVQARSPTRRLRDEVTPIRNPDAYARMYYTDDILRLPPPEWLLEKVVERNGVTVLSGAFQTGKTFLALDWALSLATGGGSWYDFAAPSNPTRVMYVLGEGYSWLGERVREWRRYRGLTESREHMIWVPEAINIWPGEKQKAEKALVLPDEDDNHTDLQRIHRSIRWNLPELVVFDTYTRVTSGMNQSSQQDTSQIYEVVDFFREEYGCSILFLHHPTKAGDPYSGSGTLANNMDVGLELTKSKNVQGELELTWPKAKNFATPPPHYLRLEVVPDELDPSHTYAHIEWIGPQERDVAVAAKATYEDYIAWWESDPNFRKATQKAQAALLDVAQATISGWNKRRKDEPKAEEVDEL